MPQAELDLEHAMRWASSPDASMTLASDQFTYVQALRAEVERQRDLIEQIYVEMKATKDRMWALGKECDRLDRLRAAAAASPPATEPFQELIASEGGSQPSISCDEATAGPKVEQHGIPANQDPCSATNNEARAASPGAREAQLENKMDEPYKADHDTMFKAADGSMMCEAHPGREWPHDECPGPGMPWTVSGRTLIEEMLSEARAAAGASPTPETQETKE